jgi:hypothetical protein
VLGALAATLLFRWLVPARPRASAEASGIIEKEAA